MDFVWTFQTWDVHLCQEKVLDDLISKGYNKLDWKIKGVEEKIGKFQNTICFWYTYPSLDNFHVWLLLEVNV